MLWTMTAEEREAFLADLHVGVLSVAAGEAQPPVTAPVWYTYDPGGLVSIITAKESVKARLLRAEGQASLCVQTETPPYAYVSVEGQLWRWRTSIPTSGWPKLGGTLGGRAATSTSPPTATSTTSPSGSPRSAGARWTTARCGAGRGHLKRCRRHHTAPSTSTTLRQRTKTCSAAPRPRGNATAVPRRRCVSVSTARGPVD
jgi:Pyridoxamine 5'-phosphate oxidase